MIYVRLFDYWLQRIDFTETRMGVLAFSFRHNFNRLKAVVTLFISAVWPELLLLRKSIIVEWQLNKAEAAVQSCQTLGIGFVYVYGFWLKRGNVLCDHRLLFLSFSLPSPCTALFFALFVFLPFPSISHTFHACYFISV